MQPYSSRQCQARGRTRIAGGRRALLRSRSERHFARPSALAQSVHGVCRTSLAPDGLEWERSCGNASWNCDEILTLSGDCGGRQAGGAPTTRFWGISGGVRQHRDSGLGTSRDRRLKASLTFPAICGLPRTERADGLAGLAGALVAVGGDPMPPLAGPGRPVFRSAGAPVMDISCG